MIPSLILAAALHASPTPASAEPPRRWGAEGHRFAARAAVETLPRGLPDFFRDAGEQLEYLDPEPDRWRERSLAAMDQAWSYDHYIDWENVPEGAIDQPDRFSFLRALVAAGIERPEQRVGFLPYRIEELYQRLVTEWRLWRAAPDGRERRFIEQRIVNDAGILGHYVTDASQPHHTTIHFNGWDATAPNPEGYTLDRGFHARFEGAFVRSHIVFGDVRARVRPEARSFEGNVRDAVIEYVLASNREVETLYRIERDAGFDPDAAPAPAAREFAAARLAAGAAMLRDLWWTAWEESASAP